MTAYQYEPLLSPDSIRLMLFASTRVMYRNAMRKSS